MRAAHDNSNTRYRSREVFAPELCRFPSLNARERSADRRSGIARYRSRTIAVARRRKSLRLASPCEPARAVCSPFRTDASCPHRSHLGDFGREPGVAECLPHIADECNRAGSPARPCSMPYVDERPGGLSRQGDNPTPECQSKQRYEQRTVGSLLPCSVLRSDGAAKISRVAAVPSTAIPTAGYRARARETPLPEFTEPNRGSAVEPSQKSGERRQRAYQIRVDA